MLTLLLPLLTSSLDIRLPAGPGPVTNPLKGYAPYPEARGLVDLPTTMTYYSTSWRQLEPKQGEYRFAEWEAKTFKTGASRDKRVVLRVYMDYPNQPVALPQWLIDAGVKMNPYDDKEVGKGLSPDYGDPRLRTALSGLIKAMGARWNHDPQVAYIQLGTLGHWGEWHTWPRAELFAPDAVQRQVLDAYRAAFPDKHLMGRTASGALSQAWLGYHDDMIPDDTLGPEEWRFLSNLKGAGRGENWKVAPTGGEMVPGAAVRYLGKDWDQTVRAVQEGHMSWIGPYCPTLVDTKDPEFRQRAAELSRMLGYEFRLNRLTVADGKVRLEGTNQGVAPFYYRWPLRFALLDAKGIAVATKDSSADVRKWLPGSFTAAAALPKPPKAGRYRLAVGLIDPWVSKPTVRFANRLDVVGGWTVLSPLTL